MGLNRLGFDSSAFRHVRNKYVTETNMSKGSKQRPMSVPKEKFEQNWDTIFGKKKQEKKNDNTDQKRK